MADFARILIQDPRGNTQTIKGVLQIEQATPEEVYSALLNEGQPFSDYFILEAPGKKTIIFQADADDFSLGEKPLESLKVTLQSRVLPLYRVIDQEGSPKIDEIQIDILEGSKRPLLSHEAFLKKKLDDYLSRKLKGKKPSKEEAQKTLADIQPLMASLTIASSIHFEKIGDSSFRLRMMLMPSPLTIKMETLPLTIRLEVKQFVGQKMSEFLANHPLVEAKIEGRKLSDNLSPLSLTQVTQDSRSDLLAYYYPKDIPVLKEKSPPQEVKTWAQEKLDWVKEKIGYPSLDLTQPLKPNAPMPIPQEVLVALQSWLQERLNRESGIFEKIDIQPMHRAGRWTLRVEKRPSDNILLSEKTLQRMKKQYGIDLKEEKEKLEKGTTSWSFQEWKDFYAAMQKKYREKGYFLVVNSPLLLKTLDRKTYWLNPGIIHPQYGTIVPLLKPDQVEIQGDLHLPGFPPPMVLKEMIFKNQPHINLDELETGLNHLRRKIVEADYLIAPNFPDDPTPPVLPMQFNGEKVVFNLPVAKKGELILEGTEEIQSSSLKALQKGLLWKKGEPFRYKEFFRILYRVLSRLQMTLEREPEFFYQDDIHLNAKLTITRGQAFIGGEVGVDFSGRPKIGPRVDLPHIVPHTSNVSSEILIQSARQEASLRATSLPLNKQGLQVEGSLDFQRIDSETIGQESIGMEWVLKIPLGEKGIASPWHLEIPIRGRLIQTQMDGNKSHDVLVGSGGTLVYVDSGLLHRKDFFKASLGGGLDSDVQGKKPDTTWTARVLYKMPLARNGLELEVTGDVLVRKPLGKDDLSAARLFYEQARPLDFAQGRGRIKPFDQNATLGILVKQPIADIFKVFAGATLSDTQEYDSLNPTDKKRKQQAAVGVGVEIPAIGARLYAGLPFMEDGHFKTPDPQKPVLGFEFVFRREW